jgi:phosphoribosylglycinamide formyltransferase 1
MLIFKKPFRIVILVSGRGSNMGAIISAVKENKLPGVKIALVVSDNPDAAALDKAKKSGIKAAYIHPGKYKTKLEGDAELEYIKTIQKAEPDLIVLAGFMRIIKEGFIKSFPNKIINIHPSLLPKYPGLHTHQRAIEEHDQKAGCTVHFVNEVTDGGKRIMQAEVPVFPADTEETLGRRVLEKEHQILPMVILLLSQGKIDYETMEDQPMVLGGERRE